MTSNINIMPIQVDDYHDLSVMIGDLLNEIMVKINNKAFNFNREETEKRAKELIADNKYWVFIAKDRQQHRTQYRFCFCI